MRACRIITTIGEDHRIVLTIPKEMPAGKAEVLVLAQETGDEPRSSSIEAFLEELRSAQRKTRSKEQIDEDLRLERESWN